MDKKLVLGILALVIVAAVIIFLVLPNTTVTTYVSYKLEYQGYSLAKATGVGADGQPLMEPAGPSFNAGEDVYLVISGISGFKTQNGNATINMDMTASGPEGKVNITDGLGPNGAEYPAPGGVVDSIYSYRKGSELQPGKHSLSVTIRDLLGGGFITVNAEFTVA
jgi:hypothetical protein